MTTSTTEITFPFKVENGRNNPIAINPNSFKVTVASKDGKTVKKYPVSLDGQLSDPNLKKALLPAALLRFLICPVWKKRVLYC